MNNNGDISRKGFKSVFKGLLMLAVLGAAVYAARHFGLDDMLRNTKWFDEHVLGSGPMSILIYVGVVALLSALGLPRQLLAFLGGYAFGVVNGSILSSVGCGLGCWLAAGYARLFGREMISRRFGKRAEKIDAFLRSQPFNMALAIRLFPLGSNLITNLAAGMSSISLLPFVLGSTIGYIPQNVVFALFGGGLNAESGTGVVLSVGGSVVLFVAAGWLGMLTYRRYRKEASGVVEGD
ncbi:TVP38/TMEM64 family protein [Salidesulfovibrio onnuriiensis]|uniref:TVP38/TMEM64 family protein n=1 Tax=Salidesulfovibrio onnuriiensis TaxID=2583823 RepID=UPI0011C7EDBA|nr:VTT domain-containing protein [Salidesulfovibrio onnuriiensis]